MQNLKSIIFITIFNFYYYNNNNYYYYYHQLLYHNYYTNAILLVCTYRRWMSLSGTESGDSVLFL